MENSNRSYESNPIVSGYSLRLYCCKCNGAQWLDERLGSDNMIREITTDGPNCYRDSRRMARHEGWVLHKDGYATCPRCSN